MQKIHKLAILGSTQGTDMDAIVNSINSGDLNAKVSIVISNKANAGILDRASDHSIPNLFVDPGDKTREEYDDEIAKIIEVNNIDLVLLIGYMRILSPSFVEKFEKRIINVHPSLLPAFAGGMDLNVHEEVLRSGVQVTGCTIHIVTKDVDSGPILVQKWCAVEKEDTTETLKQKVQELEGHAFVEAIRNYESLTKNNNVVIKKALLSVSDKTGIVEFARKLIESGVEIVSTGGTATTIREAGLAVSEVSDLTSFPEIFNGRVKTLHPLVHGAILGRRDKDSEEAKVNNIDWIDLVVCNLYPFEKTVSDPECTAEEAISKIDIGGHTMIRSAAKNQKWAAPVVDPSDYNEIANEISSNSGLKLETRVHLATKAFAHTAKYDSAIFNYFSKEKYPETKIITAIKQGEPRYGENPNQSAAYYRLESNVSGPLNTTQLQGKKMSFNNIMDADAAMSMLSEFSKPACIVVKHANPCGISEAENINLAFKRAWETDSKSAFGGIVCLNEPCTPQIAEFLSKVFIEIIIAPNFSEECLRILSKKDKLRILETRHVSNMKRSNVDIRHFSGGLLIQDANHSQLETNDLEIVTSRTPDQKEIEDLLFAWKVVKHIKSNAIVICSDKQTLGVGAGQVSRIDSVQIAIDKSPADIDGSILASDAFFPFRDNIDKIASKGIKAIIQPGGSIKDSEVIEACNEYGIAMVFTGTRCFLH